MNSKHAFLFQLLRALVARLAFLLSGILCVVANGAPLRVALYDDAGSTGRGVPVVQAQLGTNGQFQVTVLKAEAIQKGALEGFDVVVFTGGSGSKQAEAIGETGRTQVRKFVEQGGGFVGICAGAYLACDGFSWGVKVLDAKTVSSKWRRGAGTVKMELTAAGREIFGDRSGQFDVRYVNGPILAPAGNAQLPDFEPLAFFRTELAENDTPKGVMINSPAIAGGQYGRGRVLVSSPHPEQTAGLENFVPGAVRWAAGGKAKLP